MRIVVATVALWVATTAAVADRADGLAGLRAAGARYLMGLERSERVVSDRGLQRYLQETIATLDANSDVSVRIVRDHRAYALAVPDDVIVLSTGLLLRIADQSELAGALAHELAHHAESHHRQQWENALSTDESPLNRIPWFGPRRRSAALSNFSEKLELAADAKAAAYLRDSDSGRGLWRLLSRLRGESSPAVQKTVDTRLAALRAIWVGTNQSGDSNSDARFAAATAGVRRTALRDLLDRQQRPLVERLRVDPALAIHWPDLATGDSVAEQLIEADQLTAPPESHATPTSRLTLLDGWTLDVPRSWHRVRTGDGVALTRDGSRLHRIDARCAAPSRAFHSLGQPASSVPSERMAQLRADLLVQLDDFHAEPVQLARFEVAVGEGGWVSVEYRDARRRDTRGNQRPHL